MALRFKEELRSMGSGPQFLFFSFKTNEEDVTVNTAGGLMPTAEDAPVSMAEQRALLCPLFISEGLLKFSR